LRYEAELAERRYQQVDPDNRLVAAEVEERWESALRALKVEEEGHADERPPCWAIPADVLMALKDIGRQLPQLWHQGLFTTSQKESLLRSLINKVVLHSVQTDTIHIRVVWHGGATTSTDRPVAVGVFSHLQHAEEMEERIVQLSKQGHPATEIARRLTAEGFRSPQSDRVLTSTVRTIRQKHGILQASKSRPVRVPGYLTISQLAKRLGIRRQWFLERIHSGVIRITKDASHRCYLFPDRKDTLDEIRRLYEGKTKTIDYGRAST